MDAVVGFFPAESDQKTYGIVSGDFDRDGDADIAAVHQDSGNRFYALSGTETGTTLPATFNVAASISISPTFESIPIALRNK